MIHLQDRNASRACHGASFPDNLTPGERRAVESLIELHAVCLVAHRHGVSGATISTQLNRARVKAGGTNTVGLVVRYMQAKGQA